MDTQYPDQVFGPEHGHTWGYQGSYRGCYNSHISDILRSYLEIQDLNIIRNSDRQGRLTPLGFVRGFQPWQGR